MPFPIQCFRPIARSTHDVALDEHVEGKMEQYQTRPRDLEIFGENLYAIHSIEYKKLDSHFFVFAVRINGTWLSWDEVQFYAALFDFPTVPVLKTINPSDETSFRQGVIELAQEVSVHASCDVITGLPCEREGIVTRNSSEYAVNAFEHNVFKYVRKNHVKTDEHWTRAWRRARLSWEN